MLKRFRSLLVIFGITLVTGAVFGSWSYFARPQKTVTLTVFIHGSVFTGLVLFNSKDVKNDTLSPDCRYVSMLKYIRKQPILQEDQLLLDQGWARISEDLFTQYRKDEWELSERRKAANFIIPVYEKHAAHCDSESDHLYFAFGHLGLLSQLYRHAAAEQLYNHVCDEVDRCEKIYDRVVVRIVSHSHGSNIAMNIADQEDVYHRNLIVNDLVMLGTPLQIENADRAYHPMFKRVLHCYADADQVQPYDYFSTKGDRSYKLFSDPGLNISLPEKHQVYTVRLRVNGKARPDHSNIWFIGRSRRASYTLWPLPLMVLVPYISHLVDMIDQGQHLDCNIVDTKDQFYIELLSHNTDMVLSKTENIRPMISAHKYQVKKQWKPQDTATNMLLNKRTYSLIWQAWWHSDTETMVTT